MTAFLALTFMLFISFVGSLMESASIQMAKNYKRADMNRAIESVFAEYQKELLEEFEVFGMDGSYESGTFSEDQVLNRLEYYGANGMEQQIQAMELLTDKGGEPFREMVARYMESKYGVDFPKSVDLDIQLWDEQETEMDELKLFGNMQKENLEGLLRENQVELPTQDNPIVNIQSLQNRPLIELVMPEGKIVSDNSIDISGLVSHRERRNGYGTFSDEIETKNLSTLVFGEYLLEHFSSVIDDSSLDGKGLQYEVEYIIAGNRSDKENVNEVIKKLLLMRMVSNYTFVSSNMEKRAEAEAMAMALCSLILLPEISSAVTQILLMAWAFGESILDIRSLMEGKKVPIMKNAETWQLSLNALGKMGTEEDQITGRDSDMGLPYKEYLRILLYLQEKALGKETLTMRVLDMIENRLWYTEDITWFRMDACISKLEFRSRCNLRRGITYEFRTYFGYR